jgi:hypothetical protein
MGTQPPADPIPTVDDVDRIAAVTDPVIRNLQITQSYHELALAMAARTGLAANWCTFATWASKQAGQTIRKQDVARVIEAAWSSLFSAQAADEVAVSAQALGSPLSQTEIRESVASVLNPLAALDIAGDAVSRGNRKVYAEIGREFARFFAHCLNDAAPTPEHLAAYCDGLQPGESPDGQDSLRRAFSHYYQALFEPDAKTRAELLLLANIEIGFHEQIRLQPEIAEALNAAVFDHRRFRERLVKALFPERGWLGRVRLFFLRLFNRPNRFDRAVDALLADARLRARLLITEYVMALEFPHGVRLRLGQDVPGAFPESLQQVTLAELRGLLDRIDPTPDSTQRTGAVDWAELPHRLHYIADLFRCRHESPELFEPPFDAAQCAALKAGRLPEGRL